ncbi:MAG: glycoside hydrolase family 10 protein [Oscillospiraceae bacterium]
MIKKSLLCKCSALLLAVCLLIGCGQPALTASAEEPLNGMTSYVSSEMDKDSYATTKAAPADEVRAIWISYLEFQTILQGKTEAQFTKSIQTAFDNIVGYGLNTVFVHARPFGDALYDSDYFPWSHIATGTEGKDPGFDPLAIMVREAHSRGLRIEAWINPYRVRAANSKDKALHSSNQAQKWLTAGDRSVVKQGDMITYNPASTKAQNLIVNGIKEIIQKYDVDGIHIDDYFYPTTAANFDQVEYDAYKAAGGTLSHASWRRSNVETLLKKIYAAVKAEDAKLVFGISPQSSVSNNYSQQYLDVAKIVSTTGYCDYVCPQIYFGFDNEVQPFAKTLDQWDDLIATSKIDLYVGVASYKIGTVDSWAKSGKNEWVNNKDLMARMVEYSRLTDHYGGFVLYRYDSLFNPASSVKSHVQAENKNLKDILK